MSDPQQEPTAKGRAEPVDAAPDTPPGPRSPFGRLRQGLGQIWERIRNGRSDAVHCTVIGPVGSGKTALLSSLVRCDEADSYSYQDRQRVGITYGNADFDGFRGERLRERFRSRAFLDATPLNAFSRPQFSLEVAGKHANRPFPPASETSFTAFDGSGGLLLGRIDEKGEMRWDDLDRGRTSEEKRLLAAEALSALNAMLAKSESVILCIPLGRSIPAQEAAPLTQRIYELRRRRALRRVIVCFTMYEKLGVGMGRQAYRELANPEAARRYMSMALRAHNGILKALRSLHHKRKEVWCVPVSAYGFIPENGGINYDPNARHLLTRTPIGDKEAMTLEAPYEFQEAWDHWHPFCTLDPFIFIASGAKDRAGTLILSLQELGL